MQDRYVGDFGDFAKSGMLLKPGQGRPLGVACQGGRNRIRPIRTTAVIQTVLNRHDNDGVSIPNFLVDRENRSRAVAEPLPRCSGQSK